MVCSLELLREELVVEVERDELLEGVAEVFVPLEVADWAGEADTFRLVEADVEVFVVAAPVERFTRLVVVVVEGLAAAEAAEAGVRLLVLVDVEAAEAGVRLLVLELEDVEEAGLRLLVLELEDVEEAG